MFCGVQAKWVAQVLSGRVALPSKKEMEADTEAFYELLKSHNVPVRHTHCQVLALCPSNRSLSRTWPKNQWFSFVSIHMEFMVERN